MVVQDTSWITGASISFGATKLTTGNEGHALLVDRRLENFDFEYLGVKMPIKIPTDSNKNCVQYYLDYSGLQNVETLERFHLTHSNLRTES